jgi:hypothetical protein
LRKADEICHHNGQAIIDRPELIITPLNEFNTIPDRYSA